MSLTPSQIKDARKKAGLSLRKFAEKIGFFGADGSRAVRRLERGEQELSVYAEKAIREMLGHNKTNAI